MDENTKCSVASCSNSAITSFAHQDLCLNHFVHECYASLDRLDPRGRNRTETWSEKPALRALIDECSSKAVDVSLRCRDLDNLQRGRLLDILLWTGELSLFLRDYIPGMAQYAPESVWLPTRTPATKH
jgi:hypothetical protein